MSEESKQVRRYFITENNPSETDIERYKQINCKWMAICKEHEDDNNKTPHIHIAIIFNGSRRWKTVKKLFPRADVQPMNGSPQDCVTYMTKENPELLFEKGEIPKPKAEERKKKWDEAYTAAKEGRFDDIPRDMWIRYQNSFKQIYYDYQQDKSLEEYGDRELKNHFLWLWGPTGTGKSHTAHRIAKEIAPDEEPYLKDLNKWWNGYNHQRVTIIEEADPKRCEHLASFFKKWCDKWNFTAECKGTVIPACRPEYIIVTSNYPIDECFPSAEDSVPIHRRMTEQEITSRDFCVAWPQTEVSRVIPELGNIIPTLEKKAAEAGVEPATKKIRVDSETGLIEPPATLDFTPSDISE